MSLARWSDAVGKSTNQYGYLALLVLHTSGLTFLMRSSRQGNWDLPHHGLYSIPVSIFLAELLKLAISVAMICRDHLSQSLGSLPQAHTMRYSRLLSHEEDGSASVLREKVGLDRRPSSVFDEDEAEQSSLRSCLPMLYADLFGKDWWKLSIPAALYVAQNLLQILAITIVSAVTYQAVTQLKILVTSLLSVWWLSRRYSNQQWVSILALVCGVIMVSISKIHSNHSHTYSSRSLDEPDLLLLPSTSIGVGLVLLACTMGSGAAVYMEKVLKADTTTSLWTRNAQLSLFSLAPASIAVLLEACRNGAWHPLLNFGATTWLTVVARSAGGFLIALILKRTDALLKGMATSFAMVLSILIEAVVFDVPIPLAFAVGATIVVVSSSAYVRSGQLAK